MLTPYEHAHVDGTTIHISGTLQELFDFIITRLAAQGKPAMTIERGVEKHCMYYIPQRNLACAVGQIHPTFFHEVWDHLADTGGSNLESCLKRSPVTIEADDPNVIALLNDLQPVHDSSEDAEEFQAGAMYVADKYGLFSDKVKLVTEWITE